MIYSQFSPVMIYLFSPDGTITTDSEFAQSHYSWYYTPSITVSCHFGILIFHAEILNVSRLNPHLCRIHNHLNMEVSKVTGASPVIIQVINDHDSALKQPCFFGDPPWLKNPPPYRFQPWRATCSTPRWQFRGAGLGLDVLHVVAQQPEWCLRCCQGDVFWSWPLDLKNRTNGGSFSYDVLKWDIGCDWEMFLLGYWMWMGCGNGTLVGSEWGLNGIWGAANCSHPSVITCFLFTIQVSISSITWTEPTRTYLLRVGVWFQHVSLRCPLQKLTSRLFVHMMIHPINSTTFYITIPSEHVQTSKVSHWVPISRLLPVVQINFSHEKKPCSPPMSSSSKKVGPQKDSTFLRP